MGAHQPVMWYQRYLSHVIPIQLARVPSAYNHLITVQLVNGQVRFLIDGAIQVGGIARSRIIKTLTHLSALYPSFRARSVLILGFGGGNMARLMQSKWHDISIIGVDIDPVIVQLGQKYFTPPLPPKTQTVIADAYNWISQNQRKFDLIYVDLYKGFSIPPITRERQFHQAVSRSLSPGGVAIFNYYSGLEHNNAIDKFLKTVESVYDTVCVEHILYNQVVFVTPGKEPSKSLQ